MTNWEQRYRSGDTPWEKGQAAPALQELQELQELQKLQGSLGDWGEGPVLVPGCGFGHDVRVLAELGIPVVGLDLSPTAVARAQEFPRVGLEVYETGNFLDPEWGKDRKFSAVWEHTCFCAIDPSERGRYAQSMSACLIDGGLFAGVFFLNPFDRGEMAAGPPFCTTVEELDVLFAPHFQRLAGWVPTAAFPGREGREWVGVFCKVPQP